MYEQRFYRKEFSDDWPSYQVQIQETDILVKSKQKLDQELIGSFVASLRQDIEGYINRFPEFKTTLSSFEPACRQAGSQDGPPPIVSEMIEKSALAGVGPMASVAGAIAEYLGRRLFEESDELIVENGGDIFINKKGPILLGMQGPQSSIINRLLLSLEEAAPFGVCSSSSVLGHSLSLGRADLATVVSDSAVFADALATKLANMVCSEDDIDTALAFAASFKLTKGAVLVKGQRLGVWGKVKLVKR
jgi:ApbE superfamily uncharacterized protein (UPF0280 family)